MKAIICFNYDTNVLEVPDELYIENLPKLAPFYYLK